MVHKLVIIADTTLIFPSYGKAGVFASILLSAGFKIADGVPAAPDDWVRQSQPWMWSPIRRLRLAYRPAGTAAAWTLAQKPVDVPPLPAKAPDPVVLARRLAKQVQWLRKEFRDDIAFCNIDLKERKRGWLPDFTADVSRWPALLARSANTTLVVELDAMVDGQPIRNLDVMLCPEITVDSQPLLPDTPVALPNAHIEWSYQSTLAAECRTMPASHPAGPSSEQLINRQTHWVEVGRNTSELTWHGKNVWLEVPRKVAIAVDPLGMTVRVWRAALASKNAQMQAWLEGDGREVSLHAFLLALFASLSTKGKADDGYSLVDLALNLQELEGRKIGQQSQPDHIQAFRTAVDVFEDAVRAGADVNDVRVREKFLEALAGMLTVANVDLLQLNPAKPARVEALVAIGEALLQSLDDGDKVAGLVQEIWRLAVAASKSPQAASQFQQMVQHPNITLAKALPLLDARRRLQLRAGEGAMNKLPALRLWVGGARDDFAAKLAELMQSRMLLPAGPAAVRAELISIIADTAKQLSERYILPALPSSTLTEDWKQEVGEVTPTDTPHALAFQIDWIAHENAERLPGAAPDLLRRLAGFGVLLRPATPTAALEKPDGAFQSWRSLNMADVLVASETWEPAMRGGLGDPPLLTSVPVPKVVGFASGVSQSNIVYDNTGLVAREARQLDELDGVAGTDGDDGRPLLRYREARDHATDDLSEWARLPYLRFGQVYEAATYVVPNGGALPELLAKPGNPIELKDTPVDVTADPPGKAILRVRYLRRVRISEPRLQQSLGEDLRRGPAVRKPKPHRSGELKPLADELDVIGRPAGLDAQHPSALYFTTLNDTLGTLDLSRAGAPGSPEAPSGLGIRLLAIDTNRLDGAAVELEVVALAPGKPQQVHFKLEIKRQGNVVSCAPSGARPGQAVQLTLPTATALVDVVINPQGVPQKWLLVLRASGRPFDHIDTAQAGPDRSLAQYAIITPPADLKDWLKVALRVQLASVKATSRVTYGRPSVREGGAWRPADASGDPQILLLAPNGQPEKLRARLPATDINTFDRWVAMDELRPGDNPDSRTARLRKWRIRAIVANEQLHAAGSRADDTVDDPAVEPLLLAELVPILSVSPAPVQRVIDLALLAETQDALKSTRCEPLDIEVKRAALAALDPVGASGGLTVSVPDGEIWELRLYCLVQAKWFYPKSGALPKGLLARFPDLVRDGLPTIVRNNVEYVVTAPARVRIEAATVLTASSETLAELLTTSFNMPQLQVDWGLDGYSQPLARMTPDARDKVWKERVALARVGQVQLYRQEWRWDGVLPAPAQSAPPTWPRNAEHLDFGFPFTGSPDHIKQWADANFAGRDASDFIMPPPVAVGLPYSRTVLLRRDMSGDERATVHRYAAAAHDRYASLHTGAGSRWATRVVPADATSPPFDNRHALVLVPCRRTAGVPKPAIKLVVPLTRADRDGEGEPGLLVVLNEPWGEIGGLAEAFEWRVDVARAEFGGRDLTLQEAGPDPTLHGRPFADAGQSYELRLLGIGPVGHSFDSRRGSIRELASTSFILEPKLFIDGAAASPDARKRLPWSFVRLGFRRVLLTDGVYAGARRAADDLASAWTTSEWHQLLPDASRFVVAARGTLPVAPAVQEDVSKLTFAIAADGLHFRTAAGADVVPWPAPSAGNTRFGLLLLVTTRIYDAAGQGARERYRCLLQWNGTGFVAIAGTPPAPGDDADGSLRIRLLEIQFQRKPDDPAAPPYGYPGVPQASGFWDSLLEGDKRPANDAHPAGDGGTFSRIVRISAPIEGR